MNYGDYDMDNSDYYDYGPPPPHNFKNLRDELYGNAYGDYRGGYGPGGGFGPPRMFGPRPPMPPQSWGNNDWGQGLGQGFGPNGPPIRKFNTEMPIIKYLMRCGVSKENLKNLPRDLLNLYDPEHCGLCLHDFDSFTTSRLHYVSKNHLKNQKKWLTTITDTGNLREVPLKARDLYCEICDVHITSKVHADSHYDGKSHRAIVEGRKNPKNPVLLQRGMKNRLDQLIRRELKHLKAVEVKEVEKETKPVQPDLYCDICKTSMTCSEQMTMHLNGKRHLAKEKQHILKMMKGEAADVKSTGEEVGQAEAGEQGQEEAKLEDTNPEENYDWGNESGNWDEPGVAGNKRNNK